MLVRIFPTCSDDTLAPNRFKVATRDDLQRSAVVGNKNQWSSHVLQKSEFVKMRRSDVMRAAFRMKRGVPIGLVKPKLVVSGKKHRSPVEFCLR